MIVLFFYNKLAEEAFFYFCEHKLSTRLLICW